jgi:hypothetical protein
VLTCALAEYELNLGFLLPAGDGAPVGLPELPFPHSLKSEIAGIGAQDNNNVNMHL